MEKERRVKVLSVIALIVAVLGLTIAFASLSQNLKINGTAGINPVNWDVHLENVREAYTYGDAKVNKMPTIGRDGLSLNGLDITLTKPDDAARIFVDIKNNGEIDAKLSDILINGLSYNEVNKICDEDYWSSERCDKVNENFKKSIFVEADWDGDGITTEEEKIKASESISYWMEFRICPTTATNCESDFWLDSILKPNESVILGIYLGFDYGDDLPKGNVRLNLGSKLIFVQS